MRDSENKEQKHEKWKISMARKYHYHHADSKKNIVINVRTELESMEDD